MGLRQRIYRGTTLPLARDVLKRVALVAADLSRSMATPSSRDRSFVLTIDTEGGFTERDERRVWQGSAPDAFQGYADGIPHLLDLLGRHGVRATFLIAPHGLIATGRERSRVERALHAIVERGHEIGLHLHPQSDRALARRVGRSFPPRASDLTSLEGSRLLQAGRALLEGFFGGRASLTSFRWGNWALDRERAAWVRDAGFVVDSSAVPGLHDAKSSTRPRFDWRGATSIEPWCIADGLLEVPITTFRLLGRRFRVDPLYEPLVSALLERCRWPYVVMSTHSTEAAYRDGSPTRMLASLERLLVLAARRGLRFRTLAEVGRIELRASPS